MSLQHEMGYRHPLENLEQEALLNVMYTALVFSKEGYRLLSPLRLTESQFNVLMILKYQSGGEPMTQTRLGNMLLVNRSNVTGLIDRMEKAGWVERMNDAADRRINRVRLTKAGVHRLAEAEPVYFARLKDVIGVLNRKEQKQLCRLLERIRTTLPATNGDT